MSPKTQGGGIPKRRCHDTNCSIPLLGSSIGDLLKESPYRLVPAGGPHLQSAVVNLV